MIRQQFGKAGVDWPAGTELEASQVPTDLEILNRVAAVHELGDRCWDQKPWHNEGDDGTRAD